MKHRMGKMLFIVVATVVLSILVYRANSLRNPSSGTNPVGESKVPSVRLVPAKLFAGDLERLRPHLRLAATGFFHAEIMGPDIMLGWELELWKNGKKKRDGSSSFHRTRESSDLSFSLQEIAGSDGKKRFSLVCAVAGGTDTTELDYPELSGNSMWGTAEVNEPVVLLENEPVPIWAYVVHNDMKHPVSSPIEEAVKNSRWAVLMKARWSRPGEVN